MEVLPIFPTIHTERLDLVEIRQEYLNDIFLILGGRKGYSVL